MIGFIRAVIAEYRRIMREKALIDALQNQMMAAANVFRHIAEVNAAAPAKAKYPSTPRLSPDASGWICDQCKREWKSGEDPNCPECLAAWRAIERNREPKEST